MPDFLPRREGQRIEWAGRLAAALAASPGDYGIGAAQVAALAAHHQAAAAAHRATLDPARRTPSAVQAKNQAVAELVAQTRQAVAQLRAFLHGRPEGGERLSVLGLREPSRSRRKLALPGYAPTVQLRPTLRGQIEVIVSDPTRPTQRSRPRGTRGVVLMMRMQSRARGQWSPWGYLTQSGRLRLRIDTPAAAGVGDYVQVAASWVGTTGQHGAYSLPAEVELPPRYTLITRRQHAA